MGIILLIRSYGKNDVNHNTAVGSDVFVIEGEQIRKA
jgi:hypothetical protein